MEVFINFETIYVCYYLVELKLTKKKYLSINVEQALKPNRDISTQKKMLFNTKQAWINFTDIYIEHCLVLV